jgi:hypothetical protein
MEEPQVTEHMTMNTIIHAAFRRDLHRFDLAFGSFPAGSQRRAEELNVAWANVAFQLHHHHEDEETIFWPALRSLGVDDSLMGELNDEHAQMLIALDAANKTVDDFRADPSASHAGVVRGAIGRLEQVLTEHLAHEERDLEPRAAEFRGSPEMKAAQKQVRRAHRGNQGTFFAWLLDGADADATSGLRREVPAPVVFVISRVGGRRYQRTIAPVWA